MCDRAGLFDAEERLKPEGSAGDGLGRLSAIVMPGFSGSLSPGPGRIEGRPFHEVFPPHFPQPCKTPAALAGVAGTRSAHRSASPISV